MAQRSLTAHNTSAGLIHRFLLSLTLLRGNSHPAEMNVSVWPSEAELHAMKLDGDVFIDEFGQPTYEPLHWLTVAARLRKTLNGLPPHAVALAETAAWCWGLLPKEPFPVQVSSSNGLRIHQRSTTQRRIRSLRVDEQVISTFSGHSIESRASLHSPDRRRKPRRCVSQH